MKKHSFMSIISLLLVICLSLSIVPITAFAEENNSTSGLEDLINAYYKSLAGSSTRATIFKTHLSYSTVESMVLSELGKTLNQVKSAYPDTYDFLMSLKDGLSEIDHY